MRNLFIITAFLSLSILLVGCNNENKQVEAINDREKVFMEMREIAWMSLDNLTKDTVIGNWKEAKVVEGSIIVEGRLIENKKLIKIMKIEFTTSQDRFLGPIGIYIDPTTKEIVSRDVRM